MESEGGHSQSSRGRARGRGSVSPQPRDPAQSGAAAAGGGEPQQGSSSSGGTDRPKGGARGNFPRRTPEEMQERERLRNRALLSDFVVSKPKDAAFSKKGSSGLPVRIVSNYYGFKQSPDFDMRMYSVAVEPAVEEPWKARRLIETRRDQLFSHIVTGFMLFTTRELGPDQLQFQATLEQEPDVNYVVKLEFKRVVERSEPIVFQFYNVVVRQMQQLMDFKLLGRHFFDPEGRVPFPNWRLELWPGFENSIRQQDGGLMLNVESVWKVLQTTSVLNIMGTLRQQGRRAMAEAVEGMMVITLYNQKAYKITRIDFDTTPNSSFETKNGPRTYMEYYQSRYNVRINATTQPMLVSEPREREKRRGQGDIYLVPELCYPCGLNEELRSNFRLMKDLATCLHMPPPERVRTMQAFVDRVNQHQPITQTMRNWGIRVQDRPVEFGARCLKPEGILVGGPPDSKVTPDDKADWTNVFRNQRMLTPMRLSKWAIIVTGRDSQGVGNLVGTMQRVAGPFGYQIQQPQVERVNDIRQFPQKVGDIMAAHGGVIDLLFAILPNNNADNYAAIKKRCSVEFGIPSQCFLSKHLNNPKGLMSICTKLVIQMNAKQGGEPWGVMNPLKNTPVIVLGYDVHHAGPKGGNSIGAMCATMTPSLGSYFSCVRRIPADREEVATCVAMMFERCLKAYQEKNSCLPVRIFMYRDGVGEGQLRAVYEQEVEAFKDRIKAVYAGQPPPKLTFITVNKRINTRFFQKLPNGQYQNPKPGLIVDDVVTRPERYDFFLVSQTARQGCVGPTHYNVLHDDSALPPDKLQMYTFKLCHMYYNWSGTVAVPAPCQNAHKLALQVGTALRSPANDRLRYLLHFL